MIDDALFGLAIIGWADTCVLWACDIVKRRRKKKPFIFNHPEVDYIDLEDVQGNVIMIMNNQAAEVIVLPLKAARNLAHLATVGMDVARYVRKP